MTVTPKTNISIEGIAELILERDDFAICGHTSPDGDCIGSTLAMKAILDALGKRVFSLVADDDFYSASLDFLPGYENLLFAGDLKEPICNFIAVDVPNNKRMGSFAAKVKDGAEFAFVIDHHESDDYTFDFRYVDPDSSSCTLIVWKLAKELLAACSDEVFDASVMRKIATCCYSGLLTDTGRFMFQNTNDECFVAAKQMLDAGANPSFISSRLFQEKTHASIKLDALAASRMEILDEGRIVLSWLLESDIRDANGTNADTENCINVIRSLEGARISCMLKERNDAVRGSLRAKDQTNVASIAREFGGGGHAAAAGFTLECDLESAIDIVSKRLCEIDFDDIEYAD